jgi:hypothetical protein
MNRAKTRCGVKLCARLTLLLSMFLMIASVGKAKAQLEPLVIYDKFTAPLSPNKWLGGEGRDSLGLSATRRITDGQLEVGTRSVGFTGSDTGVGTNFVFLAHPDPEEVTEMKASITATGVSVPGCSSNTTPTQAFAVLAGAFFNTATPSNDDQTNDVIAAIGLSQDSASLPLSVIYYVIECTNEHCSTFNLIGSGVLGGTVPIGTAVKVEMQWDQPNKQFIFTRGKNSTRVSYLGTSDASSPGLPFKELEVFNNVANCTTTPRPIANISALFDNVFLNQSAVTPYGASLNPSPSEGFAMLSGIGISGLLVPLRRRRRQR